MLTSDRVTLRAVEREDLKRLHELNQDVALNILGSGEWEPLSFASYEKRFEKQLADENKSQFVIEIAGKIVGDIGLHHRDPRSRVSALGVGIYDADYVGQGYGREALQLFLDWAFRIQNYERLWLDTWESNQRAIRC